MSNIKNVVFDLGSVILRKNAASTLIKIVSDQNDYQELLRFFDYTLELDLGTKTLKERFEDCHFNKDLYKYKDNIITYYKLRDYNEDLLNLISTLKQHNYHVYVLSDNNSDVANYYPQDPTFSNVDGWVFSCDFGTIKKDGILFDLFVNKYNLKPEECYFIDDKEENIKACEEHGLIGYQFNEKDDINKLLNDMKDKGINI